MAELLELQGLSKYFGNVIALHNITTSVKAGEVTCVLGDNGAGKSTFIKILAGAHTPSEGEMLLQVTACGVCFSDVHKIRFQRMEDPVVLGHEVAGRVVESNAAKFKVDDRVVVAHHVPCGRCHYCCHGNISMCAEFKKTNLDPGGFAEFVRVPVEHVESVAFPIPDSLTDNEASFMEPLACCVRAVTLQRSASPGSVRRSATST